MMTMNKHISKDLRAYDCRFFWSIISDSFRETEEYLGSLQQVPSWNSNRVLPDCGSITISVKVVVCSSLSSFEWNVLLKTWLNLKCPVVQSREVPYVYLEGIALNGKRRSWQKQTVPMMVTALQTRYMTCYLYLKCQRWDRNHLPFFRCPLYSQEGVNFVNSSVLNPCRLLVLAGGHAHYSYYTIR
jgi:hypothetical protein